MEVDERVGPRWPGWVGLPLCVLGFGIAAYLTYEHYTGSQGLTCPLSNHLINCLAVTTSKYSIIHGIPVADLGLVFFFIMGAFQSPWAWASPNVAIRGGRVLWSLVGVGTAVWLIYAELFKVHNICLWCTSVHIISLVIFVLTVFGTLATAPPIDEDEEDDYEIEDPPVETSQLGSLRHSPQAAPPSSVT